jgi:hypothetical protein
VCGNFYGGVIIDGVWYSDPLFTDDEPDPFVIKLKKDGSVDWFNRLVFEGSQPKGKGIRMSETGKSAIIPIASAYTSATASGQAPISLNGSGHFLWTLDTDGDNQLASDHPSAPESALRGADTL